MSSQNDSIRVRRLLAGEPILAPTRRAWEDGVTFNAAVTYLAGSQRALIARVMAAVGCEHPPASDGLVVVHYRARPRSDPGYLITRSYVGLALYTPQFELIHRAAESVVRPGTTRADPDYLGVEDPRVTRVGDRFVMIYCGSGLDDAGAWRGALCAADSDDLVSWTKRGPIDLRFSRLDPSKAFDQSYFDNLAGATGSTRYVNNKDGVLCPGPIAGAYYLLHRPMVGRMSEWAIHLARASTPCGPWVDLGTIARQEQDPEFADAWIGAGAVPLDLGGGRFLEIYHSGHRAADGSRLYTLGAMILNFSRLDRERPASVVEGRLDHFMVPQTKWEIEGPYPDSVGNVLFTCGAFERDGDIFIFYGGGDTFVMAAAVRRDDLLAAVATS